MTTLSLLNIYNQIEVRLLLYLILIAFNCIVFGEGQVMIWLKLKDDEQARSEVIPSFADVQIIDLAITDRKVAEYYILGRTSAPVL